MMCDSNSASDWATRNNFLQMTREGPASFELYPRVHVAPTHVPSNVHHCTRDMYHVQYNAVTLRPKVWEPLKGLTHASLKASKSHSPLTYCCGYWTFSIQLL